jgi:peptidoglycan/LPS O-acetylase OafA/YrhL
MANAFPEGVPAPTRAIAAPAGRLAHIEGLRALAAYVVYINHTYAQVWLPPKPPPSFLSAFWYSLVAGHLAVTVFITLSGFCLMLPVTKADGHLRGGTVGFFKRRARRILPPYYASVAFCLLLIGTVMGKPTGTLWDVPIGVNKVAVIAHLALVQDIWGTSKINYVLWSIAVEWQIYIVFPLLVWAWRTRGWAATVGAALVVGYAIRIGGEGTRIDRAHAQYLGLFALGMLAAYVTQSRDPAVQRVRDGWPWVLIAGGFIALTCGLTLDWGVPLGIRRFHWLDFPVSAATMAALIGTSRPSGGWLQRALAWRPLVFIGTFSYSVYLLHAPLLQILWQFVLTPLHVGPVGMFAFFLGPGALLVLGASWLFFRAFEYPFLTAPSPRAMDRARVPAAAE